MLSAGTTEATTVLGAPFYDVFQYIHAFFWDMAGDLFVNKLFLIGLVIFVIGACIALVKRVIR